MFQVDSSNFLNIDRDNSLRRESKAKKEEGETDSRINSIQILLLVTFKILDKETVEEGSREATSSIFNSYRINSN